MNHPETVPTRIDESPIRIPNATVDPPTPHVPRQLEAPPLSLLPEVRVGVGLDSVEDGEGDVDDNNTEDKDGGGGGNEIDVPDGPALQNL